MFLNTVKPVLSGHPLDDLPLALNLEGSFETIPGPILGKYRPSRDRK